MLQQKVINVLMTVITPETACSTWCMREEGEVSLYLESCQADRPSWVCLLCAALYRFLPSQQAD